MSTVGRSLQEFLHLQRSALSSEGAKIELREQWVAPVAYYDAPNGFGESAWFDAQPTSVLAWQVDGADVVCEWGPDRGRILQRRNRVVTLQPAGVPNHYTASGAIRFAQFVIPPSLLRHVGRELGMSGSPASLRSDLIGTGDPTFHGLLDTYLQRALSREDVPTAIEMQARAILILERLLTVHHAGRCRTEKGGLAPWQLKRAHEYIAEHLAENVGLVELAGLVDLSPKHFARAFKQSTGTPPHQFLLQQRVARAKELLARHDGGSIAEIALACGFADQSHFTAAFRKATGQPPGAYRREALE